MRQLNVHKHTHTLYTKTRIYVYVGVESTLIYQNIIQLTCQSKPTRHTLKYTVCMPGIMYSTISKSQDTKGTDRFGENNKSFRIELRISTSKSTSPFSRLNRNSGPATFHSKNFSRLAFRISAATISQSSDVGLRCRPVRHHRSYSRRGKEHRGPLDYLLRCTYQRITLTMTALELSDINRSRIRTTRTRRPASSLHLPQ